ncbi:ChaN family lipoprotein [Mongoliibacter ruber]|uniref:Putative iron-regulated protein n=1 Tax=Mongoliibacter ruber TaxID=1750599 RepID=A0A2T0WN17_9BACT|nr:ChaN family lipoprotein [Mongoliibacter ruber]PRY88097.1 putative iron-regulated protein [Mongoliibacter ruber]
MHKGFLITIVLLLVFTISHAQVKAFKIFDKNGEEVSFEQLAEESSQAEIVFFGELHNNSIAHWLQLRLLKGLHQTEQSIILAGEFFERDDQLNIDEWFSGKITDKNFEAEAKLWNNYSTDYKPLMLYAKKNDLPFIASNVPRKYASLVSREGLKALDSLSIEAKSNFPPLPIHVDKELPGYVGMKEMMHGSSMNVDFMIEAQALKDATMAYSLFEYIGEGHNILHINGSYHSNNYEGIVWYIKQAYPDINLLTINTVELEDDQTLDEKQLKSADFIIVVPADSPKSY